MSDAGGDGEKKHDRRLNDYIAVTVVILTVFLAISKVKDDNIVQAMQKAQSTAVDAWAEYQSTRVKLHVDENGLATLRLLESSNAVDKAVAAKQVAEYEADIADPASVYADPTRRSGYLRMYGNICYDTRDQYVNFPWSSEQR